MRESKSLIISIVSLLFSNFVYAQYYKTLPKGVRVGVYRNVKTSDIDSTYNHTDSASPLSFEINANIQTLESIEHDTVSSVLSLLKQYPEAYNKLNLGTYKIEASANVQVDGYGFAYGITDRVTAYASLPIYSADVKMKYARPQGNNNKEVAGILQQYTNDDTAQSIGSFIDQYAAALDVDGSFLQNLVVNNFGYQEVGDWHGSGLGDLEFGVMYNFLQTDDFGLLLTVGAVAPTGRIDDPDIIQDIGFGNGQWDAFAEFGGGRILNKWFNLNTYLRYTYQFASQKKLRAPFSADLDFGDTTTNFEEKLGNKTLWHISTDIKANDWLMFNAAYEYNHTGKAEYISYDKDFQDAEEYLASNTESVEHNIRLTGELSSVTPFMKKNFILPASIKLMYQTMIEGRNTPKVERYEVEFRMFF